jgi:hypothetical protein
MGQAEVDPSSVPAAAEPARGRRPWVQGMACLAIVPLLGFIGQTGRTLWGEWTSLRRDQVEERESAIVGYVDINPKVSYASHPRDWSHDEGEDSLLWAGWEHGEHRWFRFGRGDLDVGRLSIPMGRDAIRAVDEPIHERDGGLCWGRIPPEARVVGFESNGLAIAYPLKVLGKVLVINDRLGDRPVLVAFTPLAETVSIYEATLDGRRVTLGHGGYFLTGFHPVLYDRGTQSLWTEREGEMVALAGRRKGASLKRIARLGTVAWSDWRDQHPEGQLLVGADRSKGMPSQ